MNVTSGGNQKIAMGTTDPKKCPALLYEMVRSFVVLADTLNLSHAVLQLGSTRQTLRRHVAMLEELLEKQLFVVTDRKYEISADGKAVLQDAKDLLAQAGNWVSGKTSHINGLQYVSNTVEPDWYFHQQQHPLGDILCGSSILLRDAFRGWALSGGYLDHEALAHVRPFFIVYRYTQAGWICVEFGEQSFYVKWFGLIKARSSVGQPIGRMPGGPEFARIIEQPYQEVQSTQGFRLDHIYTTVSRQDGGPLISVSYKRLMMAGRFPDGSMALIGLVEPTRDISIHGVNSEAIPDLPDGISINFAPSEAKYEQN